MADETIESVEPTPEFYQGDNNPYRGIENHGVVPTEDPHNPPTHEETAIDWAEPEPEVEPILVKVVESESDETKEWGGSVWPITTNLPLLLASRMKKRINLHIQNDGPDDVYLGPNSILSAFNAPVKLTSGGTFALSAADGAVWAALDKTEGKAVVRVAWEYVK